MEEGVAAEKGAGQRTDSSLLLALWMG